MFNLRAAIILVFVVSELERHIIKYYHNKPSFRL
jgi:hypothetical protein